jgi:pyruvate, water dikinase
MQLIRNFSEISKFDVAIAGGKGASLGEMAQANFPIPNGFVILSDSFIYFLENSNLDTQIENIWNSIDYQNEKTLGKASKNIEKLTLAAKIPQDIEDEINKYHQQLNSKFVAVRSSATAEDSSAAAWAGQLESYLNTIKENLLENVKKCWASLFSPRAIFYCFQNNLNHKNIAVAVVVQKMINSQTAGVMFSANPVTSNKNQIILEACLGLGESLVQGLVTPDNFLIDKKSLKIIEKTVNLNTLSDNQVIELSKLAIKIENHYGFPVDIEWAIDSSQQIFILQSRPITTLK